MNLLAGVPFLAVVGGLLVPFLFLDGGPAYLALLWKSPALPVAMAFNLAVMSYWVARRLSQAFLLRSTGAKLRASHEAP